MLSVNRPPLQRSVKASTRSVKASQPPTLTAGIRTQLRTARETQKREAPAATQESSVKPEEPNYTTPWKEPMAPTSAVKSTLKSEGQRRAKSAPKNSSSEEDAVSMNIDMHAPKGTPAGSARRSSTRPWSATKSHHWKLLATGDAAEDTEMEPIKAAAEGKPHNASVEGNALLLLGALEGEGENITAETGVHGSGEAMKDDKAGSADAGDKVPPQQNAPAASPVNQKALLEGGKAQSAVCGAVIRQLLQPAIIQMVPILDLNKAAEISKAATTNQGKQAEAPTAKGSDHSNDQNAAVSASSSNKPWRAMSAGEAAVSDNVAMVLSFQSPISLMAQQGSSLHADRIDAIIRRQQIRKPLHSGEASQSSTHKEAFAQPATSCESVNESMEPTKTAAAAGKKRTSLRTPQPQAALSSTRKSKHSRGSMGSKSFTEPDEAVESMQSKLPTVRLTKKFAASMKSTAGALSKAKAKQGSDPAAKAVAAPRRKLVLRKNPRPKPQAPTCLLTRNPSPV